MSANKSNTTTWIIIGIVVLLVLIGGGVGLWYYMKTDVVVSISPLTDTLMQNGSQQFSAIVQDTGGKNINTNVTWSIDNSALGRIDPNGRFTATGSSGIVLVTATSIEDPSKSASATVTLLPSMPIYLKTNGIITSSDPLFSRDRAYYATTSNDNGRFCVKTKDNTDKWCTPINKPAGSYFTKIQADGNLCTYPVPATGQPTGASIWCSRSKSDSKDNYVVMDDTGKLCIHKGSGPDDNKGELWCSG